ncbi:hypothetical protein [Deinococcus sp. UYEF24]
MLLINGGALPYGVPLMAPTLTDAQNHVVPSSPWLNRPLKVVRETETAYQLAEGKAQVWLPKQLLETKSAFPLSQTLNSRAIARELNRATVSVNGQPLFPCEVVAGYHALVTLKTARVASVWSVEGGSQGAVMANQRPRTQAVLVMLTPTAGVRFMAAALDSNLQDQSAKLMAQVSKHCTALPALYASVDDLHRVLSTAPAVHVPTLPNDPDAQQRALIGWTKAQILAHYGSPNEPGTLKAILKLRAWSYGEDAYSTVQFHFNVKDQVDSALVGRSP